MVIPQVVNSIMRLPRSLRETARNDEPRVELLHFTIVNGGTMTSL
ncbi:MAG: hypothetical protein ACTSXL_04855 [Alphaproteobacteria bacterium]